MRKNFGFRFLIAVAVFLNVMFLAGQTLSLFDPDLTVALGLQESAAELTDAGIAFAFGFAFGDTVFYVPLFVAGIVGLLKRRSWGLFCMFGALAVTVYWPIVHLYAIYAGREALHLGSEKYVAYSVLLPLISLYGLWGMWFLYVQGKEEQPWTQSRLPPS